MSIVAPEESFTEVDFKEGTILFRPFTQKVRFILHEEEALPVTVNIFFGIRSVNKLLWFLNYFKKKRENPILTLRPRGNKDLEGGFFFDVPGFPVYNYARVFGLKRILEKNIDSLNARVFSSFEVRVGTYEHMGTISKMTVCPVIIDSTESIVTDELWDESLLRLKTEVLFSRDN